MFVKFTAGLGLLLTVLTIAFVHVWGALLMTKSEYTLHCLTLNIQATLYCKMLGIDLSEDRRMLIEKLEELKKIVGK